MASYTPSLGLELITPGSQSGLWGNTTNNSLTLVDQAITGVTPISFAAASGTTYTLTNFNGAADEARSAVLNITGTATGSNTVVVPNKQKTYLVRNNTTQDVVFRTPSPSATYTVGAGYSILIFCDGNNNVFTGIASPSVGTLSVNGGGTGTTTFGSGGFVKSTGGTNALTSSLTVNAATEVSGVLPVSNGGTGQSSLAGGALLFGNGTGPVGTFIGTGVGQVATWNGSAWTAVAPTSSGVTSIAGSGINVSPATGAVTITLTSGNITGALGYTPVSSTGAGASGTWNINISGNAATATNATNATNSGSLGGFSSSAYARYAAAGTWSAAQTVSGLGDGVGGFNVTSGGKTSFVSNTSIQITANGCGLYSADGTGVALSVPGASWQLGGGNATFVGGGNCFKPGGGSWAASSDARLKTNATPLTNALATVMALNPVSYNWKYETMEPTVGFIAQEVQAIIPTAIGEVAPTEEQKPFVEDDTVFTIGWKNDMFAYLVGAIKELKTEIDLLKAAK